MSVDFLFIPHNLSAYAVISNKNIAPPLSPKVARWLDFYDLAISEQGKPAPKKEEKKSPKQMKPRDECPSELEC